MKRKSALQNLQKLVSRCKASILYKPLKDEVDYNTCCFPLKIHAEKIILPNNKNSNPLEWSEKCIVKFKKTKTYILIPGKQFDTHGTRHGKGGGWYDRFLSEVPSSWLRIGVADKSQISNTKLLKQSWDKSVDWIIIYDGFSCSVRNTSSYL